MRGLSMHLASVIALLLVCGSRQAPANDWFVQDLNQPMVSLSEFRQQLRDPRLPPICSPCPFTRRGETLFIRGTMGAVMAADDAALHPEQYISEQRAEIFRRSAAFGRMAARCHTELLWHRNMNHGQEVRQRVRENMHRVETIRHAWEVLENQRRLQKQAESLLEDPQWLLWRHY